MAFEVPGNQYSFVAGASLTAEQYHFVRLHTDGTVIPMTGETQKPSGILQNAPASGAMATVMGDGISKIKCNSALTCADLVASHTDGSAEPVILAAGTRYPVGQVIQATTMIGGVGVIVFNCKSPARGA